MSYPESGDVTFTASEAVLLHQAVRDYIVRGTLGNRSLPDGYGPLHVKLASSVRGTKTCAPQQQSTLWTADELIGTAEAAAILNCSERWVRNICDELDGRKIGGRSFFPRCSVLRYIERKAHQHK